MFTRVKEVSAGGWAPRQNTLKCLKKLLIFAQAYIKYPPKQDYFPIKRLPPRLTSREALMLLGDAH